VVLNDGTLDPRGDMCVSDHGRLCVLTREGWCRCLSVYDAVVHAALRAMGAEGPEINLSLVPQGTARTSGVPVSFEAGLPLKRMPHSSPGSLGHFALGSASLIAECFLSAQLRNYLEE